MSEYIKEHMGVILVTGLLFVVGITLGLICKEDGKGIFFSVNYPDNGGSMFAIGRTATNVTGIDLTTISEAEAHILIEKISNLPVKGHISNELREMVRDSEGPFARIPVDIKLHFTNDSKISGPVAIACKHTPIYKNPVIAYELKDNTGETYQIKGIMSLHAVWDNQKTSDCPLNSDAYSGFYDVWVSKEYVESWLGGPIDPLLTNILVKANVVASSM